MRRTIVAITAVVSLLTLAAPASAATDGFLTVSTLGSNGYARCAYLTALGAGQPDAGNGTVYWSVPVRAGRAFTLTPTGPTAPAMEIAVLFYSSLGDCAAAPPTGGTHNEAGLGEAERGVVPAGTGHALVVMTAGVPGSTFTWAN